MKSKGIVWLPILIMIAAVGAFCAMAYLAWQVNNPVDSESENANVVVAPNTNADNQNTVVEDIPSSNDFVLYTNSELGFSLNIPKNYFPYDGGCTKDDQGYYQLKPSFVPSATFATDSTFYLTRQYFYTQTKLVEARYTGCERTNTTLEVVQSPSQTWMGWKLEFADVTSEQELNAFIQHKWGKGCSVGSETDSEHQNGVKQITVQGDGLDLGSTACPLNFAYRLLYAPSLGRVVAWDMGQEPLFWKTDSIDIVAGANYDEEIADSFQFLDTGTQGVGADQETYTNDALGISFQYPPSWGPIETTTESATGEGTGLRVNFSGTGETSFGGKFQLTSSSSDFAPGREVWFGDMVGKLASDVGVEHLCDAEFADNLFIENIHSCTSTTVDGKWQTQFFGQINALGGEEVLQFVRVVAFETGNPDFPAAALSAFLTNVNEPALQTSNRTGIESVYTKLKNQSADAETNAMVTQFDELLSTLQLTK